MIAYNDIDLLRNDPNNKRVFDQVVKNRKVRLGELQEQVDTDISKIKRALHQLEKADLVAKRAAPLEDYTIYYMTRKGLRVNREIKRRSKPAFV